MVMDGPVVPPSQQCNFWDNEGRDRCPYMTDNTEPGPDADLCPEHRAMMQEQRKQWTT
jgi:hypothetical protein